MQLGRWAVHLVELIGPASRADPLAILCRWHAFWAAWGEWKLLCVCFHGFLGVCHTRLHFVFVLACVQGAANAADAEAAAACRGGFVRP